jgi:hypothetical protein
MPDTSHTLRLHPLDNVVVALVELPEGTRVAKEEIVCPQTVPAGHKVAAGPKASRSASAMTSSCPGTSGPSCEVAKSTGRSLGSWNPVMGYG